MEIKEHTLHTEAEKCRNILSGFLGSYLNPAFGALPKKEIDLLVLKMLEELEYIKKNPSLYHLISKLKVTRAKARNLIYDQELRRLNSAELDKKVKDALKKPILLKDGDFFWLQIENPLVSDHIRDKLANFGIASEISISQSNVKIPLKAVIKIIESFLNEQEQEKTRQDLIKAGAPDKSFKGVVISTVKTLAKKYAQESGEAVIENIGEYFGPIIDGAIETGLDKFSDLFQKNEQ